MTAPLILVVGPSGAGKDALIDGARQRLAGSRRFHFARRVVTRPAVSGCEDHDSLTPDEFRQQQKDGLFLLSWEAHGLSYGLPVGEVAPRHHGMAVVANLSRNLIDQARRDLAPVAVLLVTASPEALAARLQGRGREPPDEIACRLERQTAALPEDVVRVINDGTLAEGVERFVAALRTIHAA